MIQLPMKENARTKPFLGFWSSFKIILIETIYKLSNKGIETRPFFWPLHLQKALNSTQRLQNLNTSERIGKNGFYIPMGKHVKK